MSGASRGPGWARMELTAGRRAGAFEHVGGILAIAAAAALWVAIASAVAAPLGDALARIEAREDRREPPACASPPDAVASAGLRAGTCP